MLGFGESEQALMIALYIAMDSFGTACNVTEDRALTLREGAMLQSFPPEYKFVRDEEPVINKVVGRHIGNAVPPRLGEIIGLSA